jgi:hypothetical protein
VPVSTARTTAVARFLVNILSSPLELRLQGAPLLRSCGLKGGVGLVTVR